MTWPGLPILVKLAGRSVILLGNGEAAEAKRRLLERAGVLVVSDHPDARLAIIAIEDEGEAIDAVARLKARGVLVNAVDRPALCDFTLPAIVDRAPVLVAVMSGGVSAGLAAAVRQRLEVVLPSGLGRLAEALGAARARLRTALPDGGDRRRAVGAALTGALDPFDVDTADRVEGWLDEVEGHAVALSPLASSGRTAGKAALAKIVLRTADPDDLTVREARWLALADTVYHTHAVPAAVLNRARADAPRIACAAAPDHSRPGDVWVEGP